MKILVSSDWHLDHVTAGVSRFDELSNAVRQTLDWAVQRKVDVYLFTGDLCDPDSGPIVFKCMEEVLFAVRYLKTHGIASVWLAGNHDVIEDGSGKTTLSPLNAISGMGLSSAGFTLKPGQVFVVEQPAGIVLESAAGERMGFVGLPYAATSHAYDPAEKAKLLMAQVNVDDYIVAAHLNVPGKIPGEETLHMPRGREVMFPYYELEAIEHPRMHYVNGHYHQTDNFVPPRGKRAVAIPGSLARLSFGEQTNAPSALLMEFDLGR